MRLDEAGAERSSVVIVVSDTAMKGLLSSELTVKDAQELGVLVPVGGEASSRRVLAVVQNFLFKFRSSRMQKARLK